MLTSMLARLVWALLAEAGSHACHLLVRLVWTALVDSATHPSGVDKMRSTSATKPQLAAKWSKAVVLTYYGRAYRNPSSRPCGFGSFGTANRLAPFSCATGLGKRRHPPLYSLSALWVGMVDSACHPSGVDKMRSSVKSATFPQLGWDVMCLGLPSHRISVSPNCYHGKLVCSRLRLLILGSSD